jgi:hypothetical protein
VGDPARARLRRRAGRARRGFARRETFSADPCGSIASGRPRRSPASCSERSSSRSRSGPMPASGRRRHRPRPPQGRGRRRAASPTTATHQRGRRCVA